MKPKYLIPGLGLLMVAVLLAGCSLTGGKANAGADSRPVKILAYINVTSGCQQATVDFLKSLPQKYPQVGLELVDFGDGGVGAERWHQSGLRCMAINVNGASLLRFPVNGESKVVAFRAPAPLNWTHEELEQAVQAAIAGKLSEVTEEEFLEAPTIPQPPAMRD